MNDHPALPMNTPLKACWLGALLVLLLLFGFRYHGMNAVVMADEWYYSSLTRLTAPADSSLPSYLYNAIYRTTTACGTGFLDCVRLLNTVFFLASSPFIYLLGRRVVSAHIASLVALLAMLGPVNSYTAYFMPESFYFFTFWVTSWVAFRFNDQPGAGRAAALGVCVGALALIKVHALFLVPSLAAFMLYSCLRGTSRTSLRAWGEAAACVALMLGVAVVVRMGFGYFVAGTNGLSLSGSLYASQAGNSSGQKMPLLQLAQMSLFNLRGHVSILSVMFAVPIAALVAHAVERRTIGDSASARSPLALYTALILLALLGMTVTFTAFVAGNGYETNFRLHTRYYNFALPLLLMFGAAQIGGAGKLSRRAAIAIAAAVAAVVVITVATGWQPFTPSLVDTPDFRGMSARRAAFFILSAIALLALAGWTRSRNLGGKIYLFGFMPLYAIVASINIHHEVRAGGASNDFDRAGIAAHQLLTEAQRDRLVIVGNDVSGMFRTRFHVDNIRTGQQTATPHTPLNLKDFPADTQWLLILGDYPNPAGAVVRAHGSGYALVELGTAAQVSQAAR